MNTNALTAEQSAMVADMIDAAQKRIATCVMYTDRSALVSHNWVVVSNLWNGRGVFIMEKEGARHIAVGPFPKQMPTLWTKRDAEHHLAGIIADKLGNEGETFRVVSGDEWWATELAEARAALATAESLVVGA